MKSSTCFWYAASSLPSNLLASKLSSTNFWSANAKPFNNVSSNSVSFLVVTGTCSNEHEGWITNSATLALISSNNAELSSKSLLHTLRPSTTPANTSLSLNKPAFTLAKFSSLPWTKSKPKATGKSASFSASTKASK